MFFDHRCVVCRSDDGPVCPPCSDQLRRSATHWKPLRIAFELEGPALEVVASLKYRRERRLARWVAGQLADLAPVAADGLTWVPGAPQRVRQRGFDQAYELAKQLSARTGLPVRKLLGRAPGDRQQTGRSRTERQIGPDLIGLCRTAGLIVVVDDVVTTGSTMRAASRQLHDQGADRVIGLAFAGRSVQPGRSTHTSSA